MKLDLCSTFLDLGDAVSKNLTMAHGHGCHISYGEETITESCLLEIHRRHPKVVNIKTITKRQEAANGADWEWHLVGRKYSLKMRVQAKRLGKGASHFSGLLTYTAKGAPKPQIKMLIDDANAHSLFPAICLYSPNSAKKRWSAKAKIACPSGFEFGCLIGDATQVKANDHASLEHITMPWHFLTCPRPVPYTRRPWKNPSIPNFAALNSEENLEGRGISRTPDKWTLGRALGEIGERRQSYIERGIMGVLQIDGRRLT